MPTTTREGDGGLGNTALPKQFSPEPPSGGLNRTDDEGKKRTGAGPREPIRFRRNTEGGLADPCSHHPWDSFPRPLRSPEVCCGVCLSRPRTYCGQEEPTPARPLAGPKCCPARRSCSSFATAESSRRRRAATAARKPGGSHRVSVAGPGKPGAPRDPLRIVLE